METSLRYRGDSRTLKIYAKENFPIDSKFNSLLQLHGELDTGLGTPTYFRAMIRRFYPYLSASLGVGLQYNQQDKLHYSLRAKKAFVVTNNGLINFRVKGQCDVDQEFRQKKSRGAAEFSWAIFNFKKDQDVRIKLGYEVIDKEEVNKERELYLPSEVFITDNQRLVSSSKGKRED